MKRSFLCVLPVQGFVNVSKARRGGQGVNIPSTPLVPLGRVLCSGLSGFVPAIGCQGSAEVVVEGGNALFQMIPECVNI